MIPPRDSFPQGEKSGRASLDRTLRCRVVAAGGDKPHVHLRALPPTSLHVLLGIAEPEGDAVASELLLATLGNCLVERIRANASIGNISISMLVLEIEAELPISPLWGTSGSEPEPVGFESIHVSVRMDAAAPKAALNALVNHAVIWSPVANTLNSLVHLDVALASEPVS